ncbi:MAG TPA: FtsX-like permease family protein [Steroidobacteraceae bacterium]|jgi:putative ABC transport system permease protein|nr:FtsX-like permease family protein [Steroidobacteraceae bacterium]
MLRHCLISAWRTLARTPFQAALSVLGLAAGLGVAILCALIVRGEYSYDRFLQSYDDTYLCLSALLPSGQPAVYDTRSSSELAATLRLRMPQIGQATRLLEDTVELRDGDSSFSERIYWADPNALQVLRLPMSSGNRALALSRPDSIVLTRGVARQIFGTQDAVGRYLQLDRTHRVRVTAVLDDLPAHRTELDSAVFVAGVSAYSKLTELDAAQTAATSGHRGAARSGFSIHVLTYVTLQAGASLDSVQAQMPALMNALWPRRPPGLGVSVVAVRVDRLHLFPGLNPGVQSRAKLVSLIGILVLLVACINFVNLCASQASRRCLEVGIRRISGATRSMLMLQFLGEAALYLLAAAALAVAFVELSVPAVNAFLDTVAEFDYRHDPRLLASVMAASLFLAVTTGLYPAWILASLRPVRALRGLFTHSVAADAVRQLLIAVQFAVLCALLIAAGVLYQQRDYATRDALRTQTAQMLMIRSPCRAALLVELRRLPGVRGAACSARSLLDGQQFTNLALKSGDNLAIDVVPVENGLLELYGIQPLAGSFALRSEPAGAHALTEAPISSSAPLPAVPRLVINQLAMHRLGFASAAAAIGQPLQAPLFGPGRAATGEIIGVAPDFSLNIVAKQLKPTLYVAAPSLDQLISARLDPAAQPQTLAQLPGLWAATGGSGRLDWFFVNQYFREQYDKVQREDELLGVFSAITLLLACLGLFALAAAIVARRTAEIGVRKAMGADDAQIFRLLLWQFGRPVLYGSLIAWPVTGWLMLRWLRGFAYHVDLQAWLFPLTTLLALSIACAAVWSHALRLARAPPVTALRYE